MSARRLGLLLSLILAVSPVVSALAATFPEGPTEASGSMNVSRPPIEAYATCLMDARCVDLPFVLDEGGDTMTGPLFMEAPLVLVADQPLAFPAGDLRGVDTLRWNGDAVCTAPSGVLGCGDISAVRSGTGLLGGGDEGDVSLAVDLGVVQARIAGMCAPGFAIREVASDGTVACEQDHDTTYGAGAGLLLDDAIFRVDPALAGTGLVMADGALRLDPAVAQLRIAAGCPFGSAMASVSADGAVTCEEDDDTLYAAGFGLRQDGAAFVVDAVLVQRRVTGACLAGTLLAAIAEDGSAACRADADTRYTAGPGLTLAGTTFAPDLAVLQARVLPCAAGSSIRAIAIDGSVSCQADTVGSGDVTGVTAGTGLLGGGPSGDVSLSANTTYLQRRIATSCPLDSSIRAVAPDGAVTCHTDAIGTGDVTSVLPGAGLLGGGGAGDLVLSADTAYLQRRVTAACPGGSSIGSILADGTVNCEQDNLGVVTSGYANNSVFGQNSIIGGGTDNRIYSPGSFIGGGTDNIAGNNPGPTVGGFFVDEVHGASSTVVGGNLNHAYGINAFVGGGSANEAIGDSTVVAGGWNNTALMYGSTVAGGWDNLVIGSAGFIGAGINNQARGAYAAAVAGQENYANGTWSFLGGGQRSEALGAWSTLAGGHDNVARGAWSWIGGGQNITAHASWSGVGGGRWNNASGSFSTIGGGENQTASGTWSTIPGGLGNAATANHTLAAGRRATATHPGSFVWGDGRDVAGKGSWRADNFAVHAAGGADFNVNNGRWVRVWDDGTDLIAASNGARLSLGGAWLDSSDRALKQDLQPVDGGAVLRMVQDLPLYEWSYRTEGPGVRHLGAMAQDFHAASGLGPDDRTIAALDTGGVALAAIQGLLAELEVRDARLADLEARFAALEGTTAP